MKMGIVSFLPPSLPPSIFSGYDFRINLFSSQPTHHWPNPAKWRTYTNLQNNKALKWRVSLFIWSYHGRTLYWAGWIVILALRKFCCHVMWKCLSFFSESVCLSLVKVSVFSESVFLLWVSVFLLLKCLLWKCLSFFSESVCLSLVKVSVFSESVFLLWVSVFLLLKCLFCESVCLSSVKVSVFL